MTTTRTTLLARLESLPRDLRAAEEALLQTQAVLTRAKCHFEEKEAILQMDAPGKNEAERKAWIRLQMMKEHSRVQDAAQERDRCAMALRCLQAELGALRAASRLLAGFRGEGDEEGC